MDLSSKFKHISTSPSHRLNLFNLSDCRNQPNRFSKYLQESSTQSSQPESNENSLFSDSLSQRTGSIYQSNFEKAEIESLIAKLLKTQETTPTKIHSLQLQTPERPARSNDIYMQLTCKTEKKQRGIFKRRNLSSFSSQKCFTELKDAVNDLKIQFNGIKEYLERLLVGENLTRSINFEEQFEKGIATILEKRWDFLPSPIRRTQAGKFRVHKKKLVATSNTSVQTENDLSTSDEPTKKIKQEIQEETPKSLSQNTAHHDFAANPATVNWEVCTDECQAVLKEPGSIHFPAATTTLAQLSAESEELSEQIQQQAQFQDGVKSKENSAIAPEIKVDEILNSGQEIKNCKRSNMKAKKSSKREPEISLKEGMLVMNDLDSDLYENAGTDSNLSLSFADDRSESNFNVSSESNAGGNSVSQDNKGPDTTKEAFNFFLTAESDSSKMTPEFGVADPLPGKADTEITLEDNHVKTKSKNAKKSSKSRNQKKPKKTKNKIIATEEKTPANKLLPKSRVQEEAQSTQSTYWSSSGNKRKCKESGTIKLQLREILESAAMRTRREKKAFKKTYEDGKNF